jgi:hypothetical protein
MPVLTRRRYPECPDCWHVYYGDVHVGTIAKRAGIPNHEVAWGWSCGFYPGCHPGEHRYGTAATFDEARAGFERDWKVFLSNRTEADFQELRDDRDWHARRYAMWKAGEKMPSQRPNTMLRCPCGEVFDSQRLEHTAIHVPHIVATHRANEILH